ncbi:hypothetical protein [Gracilimonas sp.]|uniref:phosphoribosyltransferase-like protein n=1 Tax=Gracilimonas sp. TaxID=1974203 RepID=UPI0032EB8D2D
MVDIANDIVSKISDYRSDDGIQIDAQHVITWAKQFEDQDQEFLLTELNHILPNSYVAQSDIDEGIESILGYLSSHYGYNSIQEFLRESIFLDCQPNYKSQSIILNKVDDFLKNDIGIDIDECGKDGVKYWIYFDDVLASGGTFRNNISEKLNDYGVENFINEEIKIVGFFFFLHSWGCGNSKYILNKNIHDQISDRLDIHYSNEIENNPRINNYNKNPSFNHAYPRKDQENEKWNNYLDSLEHAEHNRKFAYRANEQPSEEIFFSSPENRIRYEKIVLDKGLEILERADNLAPSIRPLGITTPSYQTFGTGSHAFTWRNISNTCPIIYWWENKGWVPLFPVGNRGL